MAAETRRGAKLEAQLASHRLIGLDTSVLIYFLEGHVTFGEIAERVLRLVQEGRATAYVTNDSRLRVVREISVLLLSDFAPRLPTLDLSEKLGRAF